MAEILVSLYYGGVAKIFHEDPNNINRDYVFVSKGHAAMAQYPILADYGFFSEDELDNSIYGCDICQEVCPWNIKFQKTTNDVNFHPRKAIKDKRKIDDWNINKKEFNTIFKNSAVKRTKYEGLKRNIKLINQQQKGAQNEKF